MSYYKEFIKELYEDLKTSKRLLETYSPNNLGQIYKHNHNKVLTELWNELDYLHKSYGGEPLTVLNQFKSHIDNIYQFETNQQKDMLPINKKLRLGIAETYFNVGDTLKYYIAWCKQYDY